MIVESVIEARVAFAEGEPAKRWVGVSVNLPLWTTPPDPYVNYDLTLEEAVSFRAQLDEVISAIIAARAEQAKLEGAKR